MSRLSFSNQNELIAIVNRCRIIAAKKAVRTLVVAEATPVGWLQQLAQDYELPFVAASNGTDRSDRITGLLGTEQSILVHELAQQFDAGLFAALSGTIKAGGTLIIGLPLSIPNHFHQRFHKIFSLLSQQHSDIVLSACYLPFHSEQLEKRAVVLERLTESTDSQMPLAANQEQDRLFEIACHYLAQHKRACILITGRRGRGKSMLLARLANWLHHNQLSYSLTAANQLGVSTVYQHCPSAKHAFVSADNASNHVTNRLLVDEAGSLPLATLERYLGRYEQVVFSTTVEGYENTGRAFSIRFAPQVSKTYSHVLDLHPTEPWRWAKFDPLEQLVDQLLLTNQARLTADLANPANRLKDSMPRDLQVASNGMAIASEQSLSNTPAIPRKIEQSELVADEVRLRSLFTLLRSTHYQTTTQDLEHLLDSPDIQIWIIEIGQKIIASALLTIEGRIDSNLHEAIVSKKRRLPHQLLPQLLAQCANTPDALETRYARVIRIAVAEPIRRNGMASHLIRHIETDLCNEQNGVQAMGASFAADSVSIALWLANGYAEFHRGFKRNPRTGQQAVAMIKAWDSTAIEVIDRAAQIHADNCRVREQLDCSPVTHPVSSISNGKRIAASDPRHYDHALLLRFAAKQRSLNDTLGALDRMAKRHNFSVHNATEDRKCYETSLRETVAELLLDWP